MKLLTPSLNVARPSPSRYAAKRRPDVTLGDAPKRGRLSADRPFHRLCTRCGTKFETKSDRHTFCTNLCYRRDRNGVKLEGPKMITAKGETLTVRQWARRTGISQCLIRARLGWGWPEHKAVGLKPRRIGITIDGDTKSVAAWATCNGLNIETVRSRIQAGWDEVDAVTRPARKRTA